MSYWKGLALAAVIDLVWIMGCPILVTEPEPPTYVQPTHWALNPAPEPPPVQDSLTVAALTELGRLEDSLMMHLGEHPEDVDAMQQLARVYMDNGWYERAIGPLARALQFNPTRRSLWGDLDRAIGKSGRDKMTDAELTGRAEDFVEAVEMWGMGC